MGWPPLKAIVLDGHCIVDRMKLQLIERAKNMLASYWFIPLLFALVATALAGTAAWLDVLAGESDLRDLGARYFETAEATG
jgi:hypothetical protein